MSTAAPPPATCLDEGVNARRHRMEHPRRECPHFCMDLPGSFCERCRGTGYAYETVVTCPAPLDRA